MHTYKVFRCFRPHALKEDMHYKRLKTKRPRSESGPIIMKCMSGSEIRKAYISLNIVSKSQNGGQGGLGM